MELIIRILMQTIGYVCVATVLSALLGLGVLWQSGKLTNETMFQVSALLHEVDLEELSAVHQEKDEDITPPEEPSLDAMTRQRAILDRNYEIKSEQLKRQVVEFKHIRDLLAMEMERRDKVAQTFNNRLAQAEATAINEGNAAVARHLNKMKAQQVKEELMKMIDNGEIDSVIPLLNQLSDSQLKKVVQQFKTDPEIEMLQNIHALMKKGFPKKDVIDQARQDVQALQADQS